MCCRGVEGGGGQGDESFDWMLVVASTDFRDSARPNKDSRHNGSNTPNTKDGSLVNDRVCSR